MFRPNEKHYNWKGNKAGYFAIHAYVKTRLPKPDKCDHCHQVRKLDLANVSGKYSRDLADWLWLCRLCHKRFDAKITDGLKELIFDLRRRHYTIPQVQYLTGASSGVISEIGNSKYNYGLGGLS